VVRTVARLRGQDQRDGVHAALRLSRAAAYGRGCGAIGLGRSRRARQYGCRARRGRRPAQWVAR
jgi:hypothetical protein